MYYDASTEKRIVLFSAKQYDAQNYELNHRFVDPEYRDQGIGTQLLGRVEQFCQQAADVSGSSVTLSISVAQSNMIQWVERNGFTPADEQGVALLQEIEEYPERFIHEDGALRSEYIFYIEAMDHTIDTAERIMFEKNLTRYRW